MLCYTQTVNILKLISHFQFFLYLLLHYCAWYPYICSNIDQGFVQKISEYFLCKNTKSNVSNGHQGLFITHIMTVFVQYSLHALCFISFNGHMIIMKKFEIIFANVIVAKTEGIVSHNKLLICVSSCAVHNLELHVSTMPSRFI